MVRKAKDDNKVKVVLTILPTCRKPNKFVLESVQQRMVWKIEWGQFRQNTVYRKLRNQLVKR